MNRDRDLSAMVRYARLNFGEHSIYKGGELATKRKEVISTGIKQLDNALGVGGIPAGNIIEIHGLESTGKTALALHIVKKFQRRNKKSFTWMQTGLYALNT